MIGYTLRLLYFVVVSPVYTLGVIYTLLVDAFMCGRDLGEDILDDLSKRTLVDLRGEEE